VYGFAAPEPIELVSLRLTAIGRVKPHANPPPVAGKRAPVPFTRHGVYFEEGGEVDDCPIYDRPQLGVGVRLDGPAVITQYDATTVLPPKWHASADATGALLLER
jgi:N-methylhydantoinase A